MQLVGATSAYIRLPFICEGFVAGLIGSLAAVGLLAIARVTLWPRLIEALPWVALGASPVDARRLVGGTAAGGSRDRHLGILDLRRTPSAHVGAR